MNAVVWIVSEGSAGHVSQSLGLVRALQQHRPHQLLTIESRPPLRGFTRTLLRLAMGPQGRPLPDWVLTNWLGVKPLPTWPPVPALIVSSGGKSVLTARSLAVRTAAPYVFIGERKPYPSAWFHTVFTPSARETGCHDVPVEMVPTQVNRELAAQAAAAWPQRPAGRLWAMLIGGASTSHRYTEADWDGLAAGMNRLAQQHGIRWLLTTSRRTGATVEQRLRAGLSPENLAAAIWWAEQPAKKMAAFVGAAEWVFVTQDSVTMVTEAVASGRPVAVLRPARESFAAESFLPAYFAALETAGRLTRVPIAALPAWSPAGLKLVPRQSPVEQELAAQLAQRLGWATRSTAD